jgi:LCP family protein required for cell wall assembly
VPISGHGSGKVNSAFADGYNNYLTKQCKSKNTSGCVDEALAAGANLSRETVANVLGISIPYYFIADFNGFTQLVDKLGGIDVYVDRAIYDPLYPDAAMKGYSPFSIKAGQHHLDGATALKYARSRETTSDFDRAARQQKIITAIKDRALSAGFLTNPKQLLDIFNIISDHIRTNLSATEIKALAEMAKDITSSSIISEVLDDSADGPLVSDSSSGTYYLKPKNNSYDTIKNIVKNIFDTTPAKFSAKLEVLNGSVTNGQATKVSAVLKGLGYEVVNTATAKQIYPETTIYDYTNGKYSPDIDYLRDRYDATVEQKTKPSGSNADLTLIIGNDYK